MTSTARSAPSADAPAHEDDDAAAELHPVDDVTFEELGVSADLVDALAEAGIEDPFPIQVMTIPDGLAGKDVCGKAKTGSGKTVAFGIPVVERTEGGRKRPGALVLVPTRELARQVAKALTPLAAARGLRLLTVYGGTPMGAQLDAVKRGADILVATPGRLIDLLDRRAVSVADLGTVVLDEADQMADMGFLPQVERILRQVEREHQTLLFSATLDGAVGVLVARYMNDPIRHEVHSPTITVDEMLHRFIQVHHMDRIRVVAAITSGADRALVFTGTKHGADRCVADLHREGVKAGVLHGGLPQSKRERTLKAFVDGDLPVLVATNVAARGLHIDGLDVVIHFDPPEDAKGYVHRSGRTARAGEKGLVVTLVEWNQIHTVKRLQRQVRIEAPIVEMFSNDARLRDLGAWEPPVAQKSDTPRRSTIGRRPAGRRRRR